MNCEKPVLMYRRHGVNPATGKLYPPVSVSSIVEQGLSVALFEECAVPCGKCLSCLKSKARDLLVRAFHEAKMHKASSFVTLTVDDEHIEDVFPGRSLRHRPFQLFFKRLRKASNVPLRYLMCAEYGEHTMRPHYHAIIFGLSPDERRPLAVVKSDPLLGTDRTLYTGFYDSQLIKNAWPYGNVFVGSVTAGSIAYCTGYTLKSFVLGRDDEWYKSNNLTPEYIKWSRRPGLGTTWLYQHIDDCWRNEDMFEPDLVENRTVVNGSMLPLPRAYRTHLEYRKDKGEAPLTFEKKLATISASLERLLALADQDTMSHSVSKDLEKLVVLKNRQETIKFQVARRKRL